MSQELLIGTRKGLFFLWREQANRPWKKRHAAFMGAPVTMLLPDRRDGAIYAALSHGHFGCKLHRSTDEGKSWIECAVPAYEKSESDPKTLDYIW
ncbi:MAG TPA: hypothetical protein VMD30_14510, partial [Tepidisphaeraceae bacterium]|nr:hypothetical protein [Tepidisphaeraceae bacterium]